MIAIGGTPSVHLIGNAHPVLSYLIEKSCYLIFHTYTVLPVSTFLVSFLAIATVLFLSPYNLRMKVLFVFGYFSLYEYTVMARNYGISMLLMLILALVFSSQKYRYKLTGPVIFLLANTNIHSALIVAVFSGMWPLCTWQANRWSFNKNVRKTLPSAIMGIVGFVLCILTIYPPRYDDLAALIPADGESHHFKVRFLKGLTLKPFKRFFYDAIGDNLFSHSIYKFLYIASFVSVISCVFVLWGNTFLFFTAIAVQIVFIAFFSIIYYGSYRHQSLWIVWICTLFWIYRKEHAFPQNGLNKFGLYSLYFLLSVQVFQAVLMEYHEIRIPNSRAREFSKVINAHEDLKDSTIISSVDYIIESMPYYINNRFYFMTQRKFDRVVIYNTHAYMNYSLQDIMDEADRISICTHKPSIIIIANDWDKMMDGSPVNLMDREQVENYRKYTYKYWKFTFSEVQKQTLKARSTEIARYPNGLLEEGFIAYKLNSPHQDAHTTIDCHGHELSDVPPLP
ncbi:hypothetical protein LV564_15925 [Komagataeibacter nataicola]|nr:hypothetical protein [Komagataeibacter nataicola]WEQ55538.1 hypothetical protein LV564_15925 [Komagataeibacter nataicola]